jgi:hypothetical protein
VNEVFLEIAGRNGRFRNFAQCELYRCNLLP